MADACALPATNDDAAVIIDRESAAPSSVSLSSFRLISAIILLHPPAARLRELIVHHIYA